MASTNDELLRQEIVLRNSTSLCRRRLLWLAGGFVSTLVFSGCGSGKSGSMPIIGATPTPAPSGGATPSPSPTPLVSPDPIVFASADRVEPTGDLANQINQFSEAVDALSLSYSAPSEAITNFQNYLDTTRSRSRATGADATAQMIVVTGYTIPALRAAYERTAANALMLDSVGYLGDTVTAKNNLAGTASVSNSQWTAAMMQRNYHLMNVVGNLMTLYKMFGVTQLADMVRAQTDPDTILVHYAVVAYLFNQWVDSMAAQVGIAALPEWKLDVSDAVRADNVSNQLDRIQNIVLSLPLGPGYFEDSTRSEPAEAAGKFSGELLQTFLGKFAETFLLPALPGAGTGFTSGLDSAKTALFAAALTKKLFGVGFILKELAKKAAPDIIKGLVVDAISTALKAALPGTDGEAAACVVEIAYKTSDFLKAAGLALATSETGVGIVVFGGLAALKAADLGYKIGDCADPIAKTISRVMMPSAQILDTTNGNVSATRDVPAFTNPSNAECDQLSYPTVTRQNLTPPSSNTTPALTLNPEQVQQARRTITGRIITGGHTLSTLVEGDVPRTFANMQVAVAGLLLDHGKRNPTTVQASVSGSSVSFFASDFAVLIRRNPGATAARVPAITAANLLCTGPGFLPSRSDAPKNLTNIAGLPQLQPLITGLGTGVTFGVK